MTKPRITREQAFDALRKKYGQVWQTLDDVMLIGFRGYYMDTMGKPGANDRGIYDDCICVVTPNNFYAFNANTDPSVFRPGIATLAPGVHLYKKGKHGISKPGGGYPAFRPATPNEALPVIRDGKPGFSEGIAINIHKGGYNTTSSEGCQTIPPVQWLDFQLMVYARMDEYKQTTIPYVLMDWVQ